MTAFEHFGRLPARRLRPRKATTAGRLLLGLGTFGLLIWLFLSALALAVGSALANTDSGDGLHLRSSTYLIITLPFCFCIVEIVAGFMVLRGKEWVRIPAIVLTAVGLVASVAGVIVLLHVPSLVVIFGGYALFDLWLATLLMSAEVGTWCRRR